MQSDSAAIPDDFPEAARPAADPQRGFLHWRSWRACHGGPAKYVFSLTGGVRPVAGFEDVHREAVLDRRCSGIARTYYLHKYREQKAALLTAWEERLLSIIDPAAVIMEAAE